MSPKKPHLHNQNTCSHEAEIMALWLRDLSDVSSKIADVLDTQDRQDLWSKQIYFKELFIQLELEIDSINKSLHYDYSDIEDRLLLTDIELTATFDNLLVNNPQLKHIFEELLSNYTNLPNFELIKSGIISTYFEDLLYIITPKQSIKLFNSGPNFLQLWIHDLKINELVKINMYETKILNSQYISFRWVDFVELTNEQLFNCFNNVSHIKRVDFISCKFNNLSKEKFDLIFGNFLSLNAVSFKFISFSELNQNELMLMFKNLSHIEYIKFEHSGLSQLLIEELECIFKHLWNVKYFDFDNDDITFDPKTFLSLIQYFRNTHFIKLNNSFLWALSFDILYNFFSELKNIKCIIFWFIRLIQFHSDDEIKKLFVLLKQTSYIDLFWERISTELRDFFKKELPNTKFRY